MGKDRKRNEGWKREGERERERVRDREKKRYEQESELKSGRTGEVRRS